MDRPLAPRTQRRGDSQFGARENGAFGGRSVPRPPAASATARAIKPVRCLSFDQAKLRRGAEADANVRKALEARLNHNLVGKLIRTNGGGSELVTAMG